MERRAAAKKIALAIGGVMAGASIPISKSAQQATYQLPNLAKAQNTFMRRSIVEKLRDTVSVLDFGTTDDASNAFYLALLHLNKQGGGNLLVPSGNYQFNKSVKARIGCKISIYTSSNTYFTMTEDAHMFDIIGSSNAALRFFGNGEFIYGANTKTKTAICIRFASMSTEKKYASSSFECSGRMRFRKGKYEWKHSIYLIDPRDVILASPQFDGLNDSNGLSQQTAVVVEANNSAAVSWTLTDLQFNDLYDCISVVSNAVPGAEGFKLVNCDMAGVCHGFSFINKSGYYPPQIELVGCHINGYGTLFEVEKVISIHITGGLYYRRGHGLAESEASADSYNDGSFFKFTDVQEVSIVGAGLSITDKKLAVPGIEINGINNESSFIRISDCHFWAHGRDVPFIKLNGKVSNLTLSNSTKDSIGKWIDTTKLSGFKNSIGIDTHTIRLTDADKGDLWGGELQIKNGVLDIRNTLPGIAYLKNDTETQLKKIVGGKINSLYTIIISKEIELISGLNISNGGSFSKGSKVLNVMCCGDNFVLV